MDLLHLGEMGVRAPCALVRGATRPAVRVVGVAIGVVEHRLWIELREEGFSYHRGRDLFRWWSFRRPFGARDLWSAGTGGCASGATAG